MAAETVIVALSGGVDSAVAAMLLRDEGYAVECLHMTNWEDDDGYCDAAKDFHDARRVASALGLPLHRVSFAPEYKARVFEHFLAECRRGRTPNPDVLCNREIKFGVLRRYAERLGGRWLATGHYARIRRSGGRARLLKGRDAGKDQSYFLHAVDSGELERVLFPLGELSKGDVRALARSARLPVAEKRDSTGICFIGERPFAKFLGRYIAARPGPIVSVDGVELGTHHGLAFYTLGQRHGLRIGGVANRPDAPWYVVEKRVDRNTLVVAQGADHPALFTNVVIAADVHWIAGPPPGLRPGAAWRGTAKTRYRQPDQPCTLFDRGDGTIEAHFDAPQRAVTPGQYLVLYSGDECLGGATIERAERLAGAEAGAAAAC